MSAVPLTSHARRLENVRAVMRLAGLDAFLVTHPPNLRYLTGLTSTAGLAVITPERCVLVVDFRYATAASALLAARSDTTIALEVTDKSFDEAAVTILATTEAQRVGIEAASMPVNRFNWLSSALAAAAPVGVAPASPVLVPTERVVERGRVVKDAAEILVLREAAARLAGVAEEVPGFARPGRTELEVAAEIDGALRRAGFEGSAFPTIVASGPNSALPHARPGSRILQGDEAVVLDFGGVYDGYSVDLTRTVLLGAVIPELHRIFSAVAEAQAAAIAAVRPGVLPSEIDRAAREVLERHGLGEAFGHGTGHGIGLEVHEEPRIARLAGRYPESPVEAGMVFTIEPGAYVPGLGGVRIEDDVLVVDGGCEVLTQVGSKQ
jgi:Xaa-Pro aminopeptidase